MTKSFAVVLWDGICGLSQFVNQQFNPFWLLWPSLEKFAVIPMELVYTNTSV